MRLDTIFNTPHDTKEAVKSIKNQRLDKLSKEELLNVIKENPSSVGPIFDGAISEQDLVKLLNSLGDQFEDLGKPSERGITSKIDRYIKYKLNGNVYSIQVKELITASVKKYPNNCGQGKCNLKMTDKQKIILPSTGKSFVTTHSLRGRFQILAVPLCYFTGNTLDFAFMLNTDIPIPTDSNSPTLTKQRLTFEERCDLLPLSQELIFPLPIGGCWTTNVLDLLERCDSLENDNDFINHRLLLTPNTSDDIFQ